MTGWRLRGYAVEQLLGRGASSEVWRGRIAASGDAVALKRLFLTGSTDPAGQLARARSEAALLTVLDHPNLVRLHALVPTPHAAVLVLDLADGGSLADLLAARGRLTPGEVITAIAPVAAALAYVHRQGVVHGDVTPANLLFTPGGVALLADLGVARLTGDESDAESTPAYLDPAVAVGGVPAAASDVFMLGAVALHALTGSPLWVAADTTDPQAVVDLARQADVSALEARLDAAGVPEAMADVVLRALVVEPALRCSAADFALDLRHSGSPVAVELGAGRPRPDVSQQADTTSRREPPRYGETTPKVQARTYGPRHAAPVTDYGAPPNSSAPKARASIVPALNSPASIVPALNSPALNSPGVGSPVPNSPVPNSPAPTSAVRRARPVIPRRPARRVSRKHALLAGLVAAVLAAVLAAVAVVTGLRSAPADPARRDVASRTDWVAALHALDAARARAFADRNPALLSRVYADASLRSADTALVLRLVPAGCVLVGVSTRFAGVRVVPAQRRATVTAWASIPASTLRCAGRTDRAVGPVAATPVRVGLVLTSAGPRIADLRTG